MSKPVRIQRKRTKGWKMPENTFPVTRPGLFGNIFPVVPGTVSGNVNGKHCVNEKRYFTGGDLIPYVTKAEANAKSVELFRAWLHSPAQQKFRNLVIVALRGKNLACWCKVGDPCHADVLLELANA